MNKNFIEVIKANKKVIIKRTLIVGAAVAGLLMLSKAMPKKEDEEIDLMLDGDTEETNNVVDFPED